MSQTFSRKLNRVRARWFAHPDGIAVFNGAPYGQACVFAYGPADVSHVNFMTSVNPRYTLWHLRKDVAEDLIVHEGVWVPRLSSSAVLLNVFGLLEQAGKVSSAGEYEIPKHYLLPLLQFGAAKSGITSQAHLDFVRWVKAEESKKLQENMVKAGVDRSTAEKYRFS